MKAPPVSGNQADPADQGAEEQSRTEISDLSPTSDSSLIQVNLESSIPGFYFCFFYDNL